MLRAPIPALAIVLLSALHSGAIACDPEPLKKHFASLKEEEARWQIFSMDEYCGVLRENPSELETVEKLKVLFGKGYEQNSAAKVTIGGCSAEQIIEAACP
jgi:hypothetical protein